MQKVRKHVSVFANVKKSASIIMLSGRIAKLKTTNMGKRMLSASSFVFLRSALALLTLFIIIMSITAEDVYSSTTLTWIPPTTNTDGTTLTDLEGFKIYYGTTSGNYTNSINAGDVTSYTFNNLTSGTTYYFAVTAYDTAGLESTYSNEVAKTESAVSDTAAPTVTSFTIPATSSSLTVSINSFIATDNVAVTGYMVNESATQPSASAAGWSSTVPTSYTFATVGNKNLYAWAKDAAGNISTSRSASITVTTSTSDTTAPTVTAFTVPATSSSLTVSINSFSATDNVAVTGYLINESATKPSASAAGWSSTVPTSYTFATAGNKNLYAWAKDAAGNISNSRSASISVTATTSDTTAPTVTGFTIPSTAASLNVPITLLTATDNVAVTGYVVTETATAPAASAAGWSTTAPTSHATSAAGSRTLYAWAKDAAGNVSKSRNATVTITVNQSYTGAYRGVFRNGMWYMDMDQNGTWDASADTAGPFGITGDIPVVGDWNGTGTKKIGVFRHGTWYLDMNGNNAWDSGDATISFGAAGDIPVVGDWNGNGKTKIGVFRNGTWYLDMNGNNVWDSGDATIHFGAAGDIPVVGDWNGNGKTKIGVFRNGTWYLDMNGNNAWDSGDATISFGAAGDIPVVGDWNGTGKSKIGVFRNGTWYVDTNGNGAWDPGIDSVMTFGTAGDKPVVK